PLPIAPRRWLCINANADDITKAVDVGAHIVDVEGKWAAYGCGGPAARRALAAAVDVDAVLEARDCASLPLFDCPAVLARAGRDAFIVCVQSSYVPSFETAYLGSLEAASTIVHLGGSNEGT